jgi:argininosuccinate lyase
MNYLFLAWICQSRITAALSAISQLGIGKAVNEETDSLVYEYPTFQIFQPTEVHMTLWEGRFKGNTDPQMWELNASISFDKRMAEQDVRGSLAWAAALHDAGILTQSELARITDGLQVILTEFQAGEFTFDLGDEDIHTAVERRLGELIGPLSGKLHTGRSRNDQVATDLRLWLLDQIPLLDAALTDLGSALVSRAEADLEIIMPGYTHLQRAQPILLSHWWLSHFWPIQRDRQRLAEMKSRVGILPLGCGALAGVPFNIDRAALAEALGFESPAPNSIDAVSDRDFAAEFLFVTALIGTHLSKLAENIVLFTSAEFGFFELDDAYSTGSSLMPQKKNPDPFELSRGKAGTLIGYLAGLLATLKGLPSTYDKDLQEDKIPVFQAYDTLMALLPVIANSLRALTVHQERMAAAIDPAMMATDLADFLVERGVPFREAHAYVGHVVRRAIQEDVSLESLPIAVYQAVCPVFDETVYEVFNPQGSIARRKAWGGTAPEAVREQLKTGAEIIAKLGSW